MAAAAIVSTYLYDYENGSHFPLCFTGWMRVNDGASRSEPVCPTQLSACHSMTLKVKSDSLERRFLRAGQCVGSCTSCNELHVP